jgi:hypothetical protein
MEGYTSPGHKEPGIIPKNKRIVGYSRLPQKIILLLEAIPFVKTLVFKVCARIVIRKIKKIPGQ